MGSPRFFKYRGVVNSGFRAFGGESNGKEHANMTWTSGIPTGFCSPEVNLFRIGLCSILNNSKDDQDMMSAIIQASALLLEKSSLLLKKRFLRELRICRIHNKFM